MEQINIRLMKDRRFEMIPVDQIVVVNSRSRDKRQFKENVRSIDSVGLYKPITVNKRRFSRLGKYELVCGEGRLLAFRALKKTEIKADVIDIDERTANLMTLGENLARARQASIDFAKDIKDMSDMGMTLGQLSAITGRTQEYVRSYIRLMEQGEERLIKGVEDEVFSMQFALSVAQSADRSVQHLLMDAFDNGIVTTANLGRVRQIIDDRTQKGRSLSSGKRSVATYTVDKLKSDIREITSEKESFVQEGKYKENRVTRIIMSLRKLRNDERFMKLLEAERLLEEPQLKVNYSV